MDNNELVHHGVRGMKWGIRRYQRKDGSLTIAGKRRVAKLDDEYRTLTGHRHSSESSSPNTSTNSPTNSSSGKKRISEMSDKELSDIVTRKNLERRYKELASFEKNTSKSKQFIEKVYKDVVWPAAADFGRKQLNQYLNDLSKKAKKK